MRRGRQATVHSRELVELSLARRPTPNVELLTPDARRQTPNVELLTPDARRQTPYVFSSLYPHNQLRYGRRMPPGGRDIELVARLNRGDTAAFEEIYHHYRDFVFRAALQRLSNTDDALDVLQDAFMKLFARFPGFELSSSMSRFLYSMVDRLCRDRCGRQRPTVDIDEVDAGPELLIAPSEGGDDVAILLSRLPPDQSELLILRFVDDLSLRQLSETLGAPVGTIKSRLHRAITTLRRKVDASLSRKG